MRALNSDRKRGASTVSAQARSCRDRTDSARRRWCGRDTRPASQRAGYSRARHERGINRHGNRQRIVQRAAAQVGRVHFVRTDIVLDHARKRAASHSARARPAGNVAAREHHAMRHIQPHHSELAARTQHGIGRLGVARHVGSAPALTFPGTVSAPPITTTRPIDIISAASRSRASARLVSGPVAT